MSSNTQMAAALAAACGVEVVRQLVGGMPRTVHRVTCTMCGHDETSHYPTNAPPQQVQKNFANKGWKFEGRRRLCPTCATPKRAEPRRTALRSSAILAPVSRTDYRARVDAEHFRKPVSVRETAVQDAPAATPETALDAIRATLDDVLDEVRGLSAALRSVLTGGTARPAPVLDVAPQPVAETVSTMTIAEVAAYLGVGATAVYEAIRRGRLVVVGQPGAAKRVTVDSVDEYERTRRRPVEDIEDTLTVTQLAELAGVHHSTVRNAIRGGSLRAQVVDGAYRITVDDAVAWNGKPRPSAV